MLQKVGAKLKVNDMLRDQLGVEVRQYRDVNADLVRLVGQNASVIVDIGAHLGESSKRYSQMFPNASIYAVEPFTPSYDTIVAKQLPRVQVRKLAIGATDGVAQFNVNAGTATNSLLETNAAGRRFFPLQTAVVAAVEVTVARLDTFWAVEELGAVDLLKIDVQGGELGVFAGGTVALHRSRVVLVECNFIPYYSKSSLFSEVDTELRRAGFEFYNFYDLRQDAASGQFVFGDAIYVNGSHDNAH